MTDPLFEDAAAMRMEIGHLRRLAKLTDDARILAQIQALIDELERRLGRLENGHGTAI